MYAIRSYYAFKSFIKQDQYKLDTETEIALENVLEKAKKEQIESSITAQYEQLRQALKKSEETEVEKYKNEIKRLLQEELRNIFV